MTFVKELETAITIYESQLYENPTVKDEILNLNGSCFSIPQDELLAKLRNLWRKEQTIFGRFAVAKHALEICVGADYLAAVHDLLSGWLIACVEAGAYLDCIRFSDICLSSTAWSGVNESHYKFSAMRSRAKSLRNIGRLEEAQSCYREIIEMARKLNEGAEISMGLLLIGKVYGNYWGQLSLFSSFVEEAKSRLEQELKSFKGTKVKRTRLVRCLAICHDALGQAYRDSELTKVEEHFEEAIRLNEELKRPSGISRSRCHLNYMKFQLAASEERSIYLEGFRKGLSLLLRQPPDERGLGIRFIQYSSMLLQIEDTEAAEKYLRLGQDFARRYSEYKTLTRAALVESNLYQGSDPERATTVLKEGLAIARKYRLPIQESEINLQLAKLTNRELPNRPSNSGIQVTDLFKRNREIYLQLIKEVKDTLTKFEVGKVLPAEFELLSPKTRQAFHEKLLLDFEQTVSQQNLNIDALLAALSLNERKRQELVVLEVVNSVARLLLHEHKHIILANTKLTPLQDIATELSKLQEKLSGVSGPAGGDLSGNSDIDEVIVSLSKQTKQLRLLGEELGRLKTLLSERLRRPPNLRDRISMRQVVQRAIGELEDQSPRLKHLIRFEDPCDIKVLFSYEIMVTVVQDLIRNAVEELGENFTPVNSVLVSLGSESIGDTRYKNPSKAAWLAILTIVGERERAAKVARAIRLGLDGRISAKAFGGGVGMDVTKLVFRELMGAAIHVFEDGKSAGIKIVFSTDSINAELVE